MKRGNSLLVGAVLVVLVLLGCYKSGYGELLQYDLIALNDGLVVKDTNTGLQWLTLMATRDQTYQSVVNGFGGYTTNYGFQVATLPEIATLFTNLGITVDTAPGQGGVWSKANIAGVAEGLSHFGVLFDTTSQVQSKGMSKPGYNSWISGPACSDFVIQNLSSGVVGAGYVYDGGTSMTYHEPLMGTFLIRDTGNLLGLTFPQPSAIIPFPTPETSTVWMLISSLLGLVGVRNKLKS